MPSSPLQADTDLSDHGVAGLGLTTSITQAMIDCGVHTVQDAIDFTDGRFALRCPLPEWAGGLKDLVRAAIPAYRKLAVARAQPPRQVTDEERAERARQSEAQDQQRAQSEEAQRRSAAWRHSGFFPRHMRATEAGGLRFDKADQVMQAYDSLTDGAIVALIGPRGTGKTQLACVLAHQLLKDAGLDPMYLVTQDYFSGVKQSFGTATSAPDPRKRARQCGLLILDEVQERHETAFEDLELRLLIDHRYGHERPTLLIANQTPDEFSKSMGPSIVSRAQEGGTALVCDWASFRSKGAKKS